MYHWELNQAFGEPHKSYSDTRVNKQPRVEEKAPSPYQNAMCNEH